MRATSFKLRHPFDGWQDIANHLGLLAAMALSPYRIGKEAPFFANLTTHLGRLRAGSVARPTPEGPGPLRLRIQAGMVAVRMELGQYLLVINPQVPAAVVTWWLATVFSYRHLSTAVGFGR